MQSADQLWLVSPGALSLADNAVAVWRASLEVSPEHFDALQALLIDEEAERARRFYFQRDRHHWTVARATLRLLLGRYLGIEPRGLRFASNEYGKPSLLLPDAGPRFHFNLSHSGDLALYAFARDREVGVDIEQMRSPIEYEDLAAHFFSARECAELRLLPAERREEAFFLCWSRKEAYIKARGKGLSLPLDQFDVSLSPDEPARLLGSREEPRATERWSLVALQPGAGYAGALVVEGFGWRLDCWQY
ncbi:MAG TPA: 4'-phosphopantetheinyl transferase superfamily protein [Ktedonobacteraceae bacterium]|jgi:4'-phosphopantetheinyl transferase